MDGHPTPASPRRPVLPTSMKAVVVHGRHDLRVDEVPVPRLGPWDALIRVRACGICASDLHYVEHGRIGRYIVEQPLILGHEVAGDVVALGSEVDEPAVGSRVAVEPGATCGRCASCKAGRYNLCPTVEFFATPPIHGAMAEYAVIRADLAHPIPDSVTYEQAALCEPISVGIHCAALTGVQPGDSVVVLGAGPIGLMAIVAARQRGAGRVIASDLLPRRLEVARSLGAIPVNPDAEDLASTVMTITGGRGADALFDTSGVRSVIEGAPDLMRSGGSIAIVGLPADDRVTYRMLKIVDKELSIHGVFRYANTYRAAVGLVASGEYPVESIVTDRLPIDDAVLAFERASHSKATTIKVMIEI